MNATIHYFFSIFPSYFLRTIPMNINQTHTREVNLVITKTMSVMCTADEAIVAHSYRLNDVTSAITYPYKFSDQTR